MSNDDFIFLNGYLENVERFYAIAQELEISLTPSREKLVEAEQIRRKLLSGRSRAMQHLGDLNYQQFGMVKTAWSGLNQEVFSRTTDLAIIRDELITRIGDVQNSKGAGTKNGLGSHDLYVISNPFYWTGVVLKSIYAILARIKWRAFLSKTAAIVYFIAAIFTIIGVLVGT